MPLPNHQSKNIRLEIKCTTVILTNAKTISQKHKNISKKLSAIQSGKKSYLL